MCTLCLQNQGFDPAIHIEGDQTFATVPSKPLSATTGTLDQLATYLHTGSWGGVQYKLNTAASNVVKVKIADLSADAQKLAKAALDAWEMVVDLKFQIVTSGEQITMDDAYSGAYAYAPGSYVPNGVELNISKNWLTYSGKSLDSYSFQTFVHEIGHTLGLGHLGNYDGNGTYGVDNVFTNDSWQMSVMSYFSQTENSSIDASYAYTATTMMADIVAIQALYGAPDATSATSGNTVYGKGSNLGNYLDDLFRSLATNTTTTDVVGNTMAFTIYDRDGVDLIDLSFATETTTLNMNGGTFSNIGSKKGVIGIARGTVIENAKTGSGDDVITGNSANNMITAGSGNDRIYGGDGSDTLLGGSGDDFIFGGDSSADKRDLIIGGEGNDTINGGYGNDELRGDAGNDTILGGFGSDFIVAGSGNDVITGSALSDLMFGGDGNDFINGGFGHDRVNGGSGADTFFHLGIFDHGSDWIQDYSAAEGDVLEFANRSATEDQFQVNFANTPNAGSATVSDAFIIYRPTGQIMWALVDGGGQSEINLQIGSDVFNLLT